MASPTLTLDNVTVQQGGRYVFTAANFTGADSDSDFDHYEVDTLPTYGELLLEGVALEVGDTFTEADLTAGDLVLTNDGAQATDDLFKVKAVDAANNKSAAGTSTVTVTDGSWLVTYVGAGLPGVASRFSLQAEALAQEARLEGSLGGVATTVFLPASVVTGLPVDRFHGLDALVSSAVPLDAEKLYEVNRMAVRLKAKLDETENSDLKALVNTWGAGLELEAAGRATLDFSKRQRWRNIRQECDQIPGTFARELVYQYWWAVLDATADLIP